MKMRDLLSAFLILTGLAVPPATAATGDHLWSAGYDTWGQATMDGTGHVVSTGGISSPVDFGGGPLTPSTPDGGVFLVRHDPDGNYLWGDLYEPTGYASIDRITTDEASRIFVVGTIYSSGFGTDGSIDFGGGPLTGNNDSFVAGFDADGVHLFSWVFGAGNCQDIFARAGRVVVTGYTYDTVDFGGGPIGGAGNADDFVGCVTSTGAHVWSTTFANAGNQGGMAAALDDAGQTILAVTTDSALDFGGGALTPAGPVGLCLVQLTAAGTHSWSQIFDGQFNSGAGIGALLDLDVSDTGQVVLGGQLGGTCDFGGGGLTAAGNGDAFVAVYDGAGVHQWSSVHGGIKTDFTSGVSFDTDGNVVLAGTFFSTSVDFGGGALTVGASPADPFLAVMDPAGAHLFSTSWDTGGGIFGVDVAAGGGAIFLSGSAQAGLDLGGGPLAVATLFHGVMEGAASPVTAAASPMRPTHLEQNHPNPFNPSTTIRWRMVEAGPAQLDVHDLAGRRVATLWRGTATSGPHEVRWNGRDDAGRAVASGVYVYRLVTDEGTWARRMALVQ